MTSLGGKLTALACHPTNNVNKAEELTYSSTNIACGGAPLAVHVCSLYAVLWSLTPHLHEQWCFWFLSRLTDFARLSVWFCQALWPILRYEFSYLSVQFCAMWCPPFRFLQKSDGRPGKISQTAKIRLILAVSGKPGVRELLTNK